MELLDEWYYVEYKISSIEHYKRKVYLYILVKVLQLSFGKGSLNNWSTNI
ncbi:hypothetical protein EMIT074MI3_11522 [Bacillus licheniformis]|nr:hypothetical protein MUY_002008 [Bacillus licheniformis WX-02]